MHYTFNVRNFLFKVPNLLPQHRQSLQQKLSILVPLH